MASTNEDAERFNRIVIWSLAITAVLLLILPMFFVLSNETYYSAYVDGGIRMRKNSLSFRVCATRSWKM